MTLASLALAGAALVPTAVHATAEYAQLYARTCSPYIVGGCTSDASAVPLARGVNIGGGFSFASGYHGGYALSSAVFAPGAGPLLQAGRYENGSIAGYGYTFRVQGAPNTVVPLHVYGLVSGSAIHLTDQNGQVVHLVDGASSTAPTTAWNVVADASLQVIPTRFTSNTASSASVSFGTSYQVNGAGGSGCRNCGGGGNFLDQTIGVWSNTDINVRLGASVLLQYQALGGGLDPSTLFGDVSIEVDPTFSIDDPAYSAFTVVGVPTGFAPPLAAAVPEPESWAMLVCGFGIVGWGVSGEEAVPRVIPRYGGAMRQSRADPLDEFSRPPMKTSARNQFAGTVRSVRAGAINDEVEIEASPGPCASSRP